MPSKAPIHLYQDDLPDDLDLGSCVAIDTETMGLNPHRDRLCLVQMSSGDGEAHLVKMSHPQKPAPNLARMLADEKVEKLFHFARFDLAALANGIGPVAGPVYCTKIASKLIRTYTDRHGLSELVREICSIEISKQQQSSDWGAATLSRNSKPMRPMMCFICTRSVRNLISGWTVKAAWRQHRRHFNSFLFVLLWTSKALAKSIFFPIDVTEQGQYVRDG